MTRRGLFLLAVAFALPALATDPTTLRTLTFENRVAAQKAIEEVYWSHRIWPKENPGPKPPLSAVMSDDAIRAKVEDYLKKSNALEKLWQRPITTDQLQAEMDRMAANTRDGKLLSELFAALGNEPFVIAETLARQILSDRLIHNWYSTDPRFHADIRSRAAVALAACGGVDCVKSMDGTVIATTLRRGERCDKPTNDEHINCLEPEIWEARASFLRDRVIDARGEFLVGAFGSLEETASGFRATAVVSISREELATSTIEWLKRPFDSWWGEQRSQFAGVLETNTADFRLPAIPVTANCTDNTWTDVEGPGISSGRYLHSAVWTGTEMIVWGGRTAFTQSESNTGGRYVPATDFWVVLGTVNAPAPRASHTAIWTGTEMVVFGGFSGGGADQGGMNTGGRYNPSDDSWSATAVLGAPSNRGGHTAVWTGSEMLVWGGLSSTVGTPLSDGARYRPNDNSWTPINPSGAPTPRSSHTAVWTGTQMIIWGGTQGGATQSLQSGARYTTSSNSWLPTTTVQAPVARSGHTAVWAGDGMIVWGGRTSGGAVNSGGVYHPLTDNWTAMSSTNAPMARSSHTAVWTGSTLVVWGGVDSSSTMLNTGGRYSSTTDSWQATLAGTNTPSARYTHTAVWTGSEMIVWGGIEASSAAKTGGRYSPATDSWVPTSVAEATARTFHTAVWTGAEMLVWGGGTNSGFSFQPATNTWSPISNGPNASTARFGQSAVWTGTEMILWGGNDGIQRINSGGRYNPANDSWLATSVAANSPVARDYHTAVWTGAEMIVWGGVGDLGSLDTGGRYNPTIDGWATTASVHAPTGRSEHSAIWTGTDMIVWGGIAGSGLNTNTGGRYNPAVNAWAETATSSAPAPRALHTGIWSGSEMIVWGGNDGIQRINSGGRYNPANDSWLATSVAANSPVARDYHTAVWTGAEMIVWGGTGNNGRENSGGRYYPPTDSWIPTTTEGAHVPSARQGHSAVWSGTEMLVWGGEANNGGRYCAEVRSYRDADGDGYGNAAISTTMPDGSIPPGYVADSTDCDDTNSAIHPASTEVCNGLDDNCDGQADEGLIRTLYRDADGDGYGDPANAQFTCYSPAGWSSQGTDCNDADPAIHPNAPEVCDGIDNNCTGQVDEDPFGVDSDGDGIHNACDNCRLVYNPEQLDSDHDGVGNSCDDCLFVVNADQRDTDSDGLGDACDNCPRDYNATQSDFDGDGPGDACDNCVFDYNPRQTDFDHDGEGDICDLDDGVIYIYSTDSNYIEWQQEQGPASWNVYQGDLAVLRTTGVYTQLPGSNPLAGRHCGVVDPYVEDFNPLAAGAAKFALVTGVTSGVEGSLGTNSAGVTRPNNSPCP